MTLYSLANLRPLLVIISLLVLFHEGQKDINPNTDPELFQVTGSTI